MLLKKWIPGWALIVCAILSTFTVWLRLQIIQRAYDIHAYEKKMSDLKIYEQSLQVQLSALRAPHRLEELARKSFQMAPPKPSAIVYLHPYASP